MKPEQYWLPVSAAAQQLGLSDKRVYQLINRGVLAARKVNSTWLVSQVSIEMRIAEMARYRKVREKAGAIR